MTTELSVLAHNVRNAQRRLSSAGGDGRTRVLQRLSNLLAERQPDLLEANQLDLEAARGRGFTKDSALAGPLLKRLALNAEKIATLREGIQHLVQAGDPVGVVRRATELDEDLVLREVTSPLGVVLIIFESRPDAVIQIGSLALATGNGLLLKGGSEALHSNRALAGCLRDALADEGLDADAVALVEGREAIRSLLELDELIDLVIPRGSGELVRSIQSSTRIPVLGHAEGICHLYLDATAAPEMAKHLVIDGKCGYPAACNATETLLVHQAFLPHLHGIGTALLDEGVMLKADERALAHLPAAQPATEEDWSTEWGELTLGVRTVDDLDAAIDHIHRYGSAHTEAIVTEDKEAAERFLRDVDAACVFVNASTRFADGYRYGLGAEVGISTGRIHARGPVGVDGLLTTRWLLRGAGQAAGDYGPGKRTFTHRPLPASS